jgi:hypothetical protein
MATFYVPRRVEGERWQPGLCATCGKDWGKHYGDHCDPFPHEGGRMWQTDRRQVEVEVEEGL